MYILGVNMSYHF